jgi:hypothetical protein
MNTLNKIDVSPSVKNKRITSVRRIRYDTPQEVFDVTNLDGHESFALGCGVIVHNCRSARFSGFQELLPLKGKVSNCVVAGTSVLLADGTARPIESLDSEWLGVAFDAETKTRTNDVISPMFLSGSVTETLTLTFEDGHTLECTPEHQLLTQRGYVAAKDLMDSDDVVTIYDSKRS